MEKTRYVSLSNVPVSEQAAERSTSETQQRIIRVGSNTSSNIGSGRGSGRGSGITSVKKAETSSIITAPPLGPAYHATETKRQHYRKMLTTNRKLNINDYLAPNPGESNAIYEIRYELIVGLYNSGISPDYALNIANLVVNQALFDVEYPPETMEIYKLARVLMQQSNDEA